jgi:hypothetical protein
LLRPQKAAGAQLCSLQEKKEIAMRAEIYRAGAAMIAALSSAALPAAATDQEKTFNGITYACAGVGDDSQNDPRWAAYPAKLEFAGGNGDYLSDIVVSIENAKGEPVL